MARFVFTALVYFCSTATLFCDHPLLNIAVPSPSISRNRQTGSSDKTCCIYLQSRKQGVFKYLRGGEGEQEIVPGTGSISKDDVPMGDAENLDDAANDEEYMLEEPTVQEHLWEAAKAGEENIIEKLIQDGAEVNAHDPSFGGWTAMHYAAQNGRWRAISTLTKFGARVSIPR